MGRLGLMLVRIVVVAVTLAMTGGLAVAAPDTGADWSPRPANYAGVAVERDVKITMSDGVILAADISRPALPDGTPAPGRFPVVLSQTAYNKNVGGSRNNFLITRGYVQVTVDVRGTGSSQGTWDSFGAREQRDGYELVEWAAGQQRWSDGRVATYGMSYSAINQIFTAAQQPAGLKAAFPIVPAGDVYRDVAASGGQFDIGFMPLWLGLVTVTGLVPPAFTGLDPVRALSVLTGHVGGAAAFQVPLLLSALSGSDLAYDGPFYHLRSPLNVIDKVRVPTFVTGGWFDIFQRSEPLLFQRLQDNGVPAKLLVGPWEHAVTGAGLPVPGVPSLNELALRWFDHYVRDIPDPTLDRDLAPVTYHELGSGQWRTAQRWLDADVHAEALHLDGPATPIAPGTLTPGTGKNPRPDRVLPIPVSGLCTRSTSQWTGGVLTAAFGDTPCAQNQALDNLTGISYDLPVTQPLHLLGPVALRLFVSTTTRNGMVAARLEDVAPDGSAKQLTAGWQVLSLRELDAGRSVRRDGHILQPHHPFTRESEQPPRPGEVVETWTELFPTGAQLAPGHRLRVVVQAFDVPHLLPTLPQLVDSVGGVLSIYHDPGHPSQLVLPVRR